MRDLMVYFIGGMFGLFILSGFVYVLYFFANSVRVWHYENYKSRKRKES